MSKPPISEKPPWVQGAKNTKKRKKKEDNEATLNPVYDAKLVDKLCGNARRIVLQEGNGMLEKGVPTELYWHISGCSACEELRSKAKPPEIPY